jgi:hypothetical protein
MTNQGRTPRAEEITRERRRRNDETLNRINSLKLGIPPEFKNAPDFEQWHYRWINDREDRVYHVLNTDDYEIVTSAKVEADNGDRVRRPVGMDETGKPLHAVLVRKLKSHMDEDRKFRDQVLKKAENDLTRRVPVAAEGLKETEAYVASGNSIRTGGYTP